MQVTIQQDEEPKENKQHGLYIDPTDNEVIYFGGEWDKVLTFGSATDPLAIPYTTTRHGTKGRFLSFKGSVTIKS